MILENPEQLKRYEMIPFKPTPKPHMKRYALGFGTGPGYDRNSYDAPTCTIVTTYPSTTANSHIQENLA